jgi:hypothetical protein
MNPAIGAIAASDTAPIGEFCDDLNRKSPLLIDPPDRVLCSGSDPNIRLLLFKRCKARKHWLSGTAFTRIGILSRSPLQAEQNDQDDSQSSRGFGHRQLRRPFFMTAVKPLRGKL